LLTPGASNEKLSASLVSIGIVNLGERLLQATIGVANGGKVFGVVVVEVNHVATTFSQGFPFFLHNSTLPR